MRQGYGNHWNCNWCNKSCDDGNERGPGRGVIPRRIHDDQRSDEGCSLSSHAKRCRCERGTDRESSHDHREMVAFVDARQLSRRDGHHHRAEDSDDKTQKQHAQYVTQLPGSRLPG